MRRTRTARLQRLTRSMIVLGALLWAGTLWASADPLQIRRISPSGEDVQPGQEAVIQFDRAMVPLGHMGRKPSELPVSIKPDPGCEWRWLDTSELACRLSGQRRFVPATQYTVSVGPALKALDGSHLEQPQVETFTTWLPKVEWSDFQQWRSPVTPVFMVRLNLAVSAKQLADHIGFDDGKGGWVAAKIEPFTKKREGPIWLPVPGLPGAAIEVDDPQPNTPLDARAQAAEGRRVWQVVPVGPLLPDRTYQLRVKPGLRSVLGSLAGTQDEVVGSMQTYGDFVFRGVSCIDTDSNAVTVTPGEADPPRCWPNSYSLQFSAPVPRATLAAIQWNPLPKPKDELAALWRDYPQWFLRDRDNANDARGSDGYPLTFVLDPMRAFTLNVPAGLKDIFGRTLAKPASVNILSWHRVPFLDTPPVQAVLESNQPTIVPLRFTNLEQFSFGYRIMHAPQLEAGSAIDATQTENLLLRPDLDATEDRIVRGNLGVRHLLGGHSGVVWGDMTWLGRYQRKYRSPSSQPFMGQVTPWQVLAKVGHYNTQVWINRLDNGNPVAGAQVKLLLGHKGSLDPLKSLGTMATTDAAGMAQLPGTVTLPKTWFDNPWKNPANFYVGVTRDGDMALLPLDNEFTRSVSDASHYAFWSNNAPPNGHMRAWAVTEQGIYKPGSDVKYAAFVRAQGATTLLAPPALDYTLTITDPEGNEVSKREHAKLSTYGGLQGQLHIPATAPMGTYDITVSWKSDPGGASRLAGSFIVTDFVPATFKVGTQILGTRLGPGDKIKTRVAATLHAGGPFTDAKVRFTTQLVPQAFSPDTPVTSGFSFGRFDTTMPQPSTLAVTTGQLDHAGYANSEVALPAKSDVIYGEISVEAAVESTRSTWVANSASVPYVARDRFVGLRTHDWMQTATKPIKVEYLVVDPSGKPAAGSKLELALQRESISRVRVKDGAGEFNDEEHVDWVAADQCNAVSKAAPASCDLTPPQAGSYRIVATVVDTHGRNQQSMLSVWVTGAGRVVWSTTGKGVTLVPDKNDYHVGDVAHVLVQNPYPGAHALITVERFGVLWKKEMTLTGSAPVIDVPIDAQCFPGAYLSVAIFSPRASAPADPDLGKPEVALGYLALKVSGKGSSLDIAVTPAQSEYKPRQNVDVDVAIKTHDGKAPGKTRLVVAVVDQGVIDLLQKGDKYYDPRDTFYAPPDGPDVVNYSLVNQLLTRLQPKAGKGESPGGGGGDSTGPNVRSNFSYAAYWNPELESDADGHAHFSFKLPDNLTRWRILVVALTPGAAMGLGDGSVRVNLPLQIEPALPNQMRVGDRFGAAFNVTNRTQQRLDIATQIDAKGVIVGGVAQSSDQFNLDAFAHNLTWLQLEATKPGDITLTATAQSGKLGDAVRAHIPVKPAGTQVVAAEYGSTTGDDAHVPVKVPAQAIAGSAKVTVRFAPTLVGGLNGAFAVMRDDPLRTWETRLSRGVLASDYLRLQPVLGNSVEWPDATQTIDDMLKSAANFQAPNGGMAFWVARNDFVSRYLSVYTALAFDWLDDAGHATPATVRKRLFAYLHSEILARDTQGADAPAPVLRAGALAALALAPHGKLPDGAVAGMLPELHKLRLFGQALLLQAAIASHDRASADVIAKSILSYAEESAGEISFNERNQDGYLDILATPLRSNCAILDSLSRYALVFGEAHAAKSPAQQLLQWFSALSRDKSGKDNPDLVGTTPQKLMRWVAGQRRNAGGWPNSQENVFCTTAITHYADAYETPVKALSGRLDLPGQAEQTATFASRATPAVKLAGPVTKPGEQFAVKLAHGGEGRLYYGVQVQYAMPPDLLPAADAGMTLARFYSVQRGNQWVPVKPGVVLQRGEIVRVDLIVDAPTGRHHVVLTDPLPGAFEAVNRLLATSAQTLPAEQPGISLLMFDGGAWPNMSIVAGGFYHRETAFDAVRFFADDLPAGHYQVVYTAQVIAPGKFIAPAPQIKEIYQPDVFGRGVPQHLDVAMPEK
ncbi:MAG TPA: MG2 domain-containing protein [Rudaea sp.]|nr:MG2 domain-containing protein [Rudaea sp.]